MHPRVPTRLSERVRKESRQIHACPVDRKASPPGVHAKIEYHISKRIANGDQEYHDILKFNIVADRCGGDHRKVLIPPGRTNNDATGLRHLNRFMIWPVYLILVCLLLDFAERHRV